MIKEKAKKLRISLQTVILNFTIISFLTFRAPPLRQWSYLPILFILGKPHICSRNLAMQFI